MDKLNWGSNTNECSCFHNKHKEKVNHPDHYGGDTTYEVIRVIEAWKLNFNLGTAVKYIPRAGKKDPDTYIEDLEKSIWYIRREIQNEIQRRENEKKTD